MMVLADGYETTNPRGHGIIVIGSPLTVDGNEPKSVEAIEQAYNRKLQAADDPLKWVCRALTSCRRVARQIL
jgi:hypothetical protein